MFYISAGWWKFSPMRLAVVGVSVKVYRVKKFVKNRRAHLRLRLVRKSGACTPRFTGRVRNGSRAATDVVHPNKFFYSVTCITFTDTVEPTFA